MRKWIVLGLLLLVGVLGCGGSGEKGKNKDRDMPKATENK